MGNLVEAVNVFFIGIVIVFLTLFFLIGIIKLFGLLFGGAHKAPSTRRTEPAAVAPSAPAAPAVVAAASTEDALTDEIVAVISAAIYGYYGEDAQKKIVIKSIRRADSAGNPWAAAGLAQNMRGL